MRNEKNEAGPATRRQWLDGMVVIAPRTCSPLLVRTLAGSVDDLIERGQPFRTHRRTDVRLVRFLERQLIIKRYNVLDRITRLKRMLGPSPARRAWRAAWRLQAIGLRTAEPLAYMERRRGPERGVSYVIMEYVNAPDAATHLADPGIDCGRRKAAAVRLVQDIVRLHTAGYVHRDLKASNVLIEGGEPVFIDLDTLRRPLLRRRQNRGQHGDKARLLHTLGPAGKAVCAETGGSRRRAVGTSADNKQTG